MNDSKIFPLRIMRSAIPQVYGGKEHLAIQEDPATGRGIVIADIEITPESESYANVLVAAPEMRKASQELYDRIQDYLDRSDEELIELGYDGLVAAMDAMESAWHKADGTQPAHE